MGYVPLAPQEPAVEEGKAERRRDRDKGRRARLAVGTLIDAVVRSVHVLYLDLQLSNGALRLSSCVQFILGSPSSTSSLLPVLQELCQLLLKSCRVLIYIVI